MSPSGLSTIVAISDLLNPSTTINQAQSQLSGLYLVSNSSSQLVVFLPQNCQILSR